MPTPKRPANKKKSFFARLKPTTKKAKILTTVAAFAIIGGGIMVFRSFAATAPNTATGRFDWNYDGSRKYSNRISTNGTICVESFGRRELVDWGSDDRYFVRLFTLVNGKWLQSRETNYPLVTAQSRLNMERVCWRGLTTAYLYRVQFDPYTPALFRPDRALAHVIYDVYGFDKEKGETATASKNPGNTSQPAPSPASNPQPSK